MAVINSGQVGAAAPDPEPRVSKNLSRTPALERDIRPSDQWLEALVATKKLPRSEFPNALTEVLEDVIMYSALNPAEGVWVADWLECVKWLNKQGKSFRGVDEKYYKALYGAGCFNMLEILSKTPRSGALLREFLNKDQKKKFFRLIESIDELVAPILIAKMDPILTYTAVCNIISMAYATVDKTQDIRHSETEGGVNWFSRINEVAKRVLPPMPSSIAAVAEEPSPEELERKRARRKEKRRRQKEKARAKRTAEIKAKQEAAARAEAEEAAHAAQVIEVTTPAKRQEVVGSDERIPMIWIESVEEGDERSLTHQAKQAAAREAARREAKAGKKASRSEGSEETTRSRSLSCDGSEMTERSEIRVMHLEILMGLSSRNERTLAAFFAPHGSEKIGLSEFESLLGALGGRLDKAHGSGSHSVMHLNLSDDYFAEVPGEYNVENELVSLAFDDKGAETGVRTISSAHGKDSGLLKPEQIRDIRKTFVRHGIVPCGSRGEYLNEYEGSRAESAGAGAASPVSFLSRRTSTSEEGESSL